MNQEFNMPRNKTGAEMLKRAMRPRKRKRKIDVQGAIDRAELKGQFSGKPLNAFDRAKKSKAPTQSKLPARTKRRTRRK